jgi:hypothetical protein
MIVAGSITELPQRLLFRPPWAAVVPADACCRRHSAPAGVERSGVRLDAVELTAVAAGVHVFHGVHEEATSTNLGAIANIAVIIGNGCCGCRYRQRLVSIACGAIRSLTALPIRYLINSRASRSYLPAMPHSTTRTGGLGPPQAAGLWRPAGSLPRRVKELLGSNADGTRVVAPRDWSMARRILISAAASCASRASTATDNDLTVFDLPTRTLIASDLLFMEHTRDRRPKRMALGYRRTAQYPADRVVPGHGPASALWPAALEPRTAISGFRAELK